MLISSSYNTTNVLCWGLCEGHYRAAYLEGCSFRSFVHLTIALLETLPILSQIISTIEYIVFSCCCFAPRARENVELSEVPPSRQRTDAELREHYRWFYHEQTLLALQNNGYRLPSGEEVHLRIVGAQIGTKIYQGYTTDSENDLRPLVEAAWAQPVYYDDIPSIEVVQEDSFQGAHTFIQEGIHQLKVAVVNFANATSPGGGVKGLCNLAQEESLARRSTLMAAIDPELNPYLSRQQPYQIPEGGCIYSQGVQIFAREDEDHNFIWFGQDEIYSVAIISSAAVDLRTNHQHREATTEDHEWMRLKIRAQIRCAIMRKKAALVLGAFGCGAFGYDPNVVANLYKEELNRPVEPGDGAPRCAQFFERIRFSILVTNERDQRNLDTFRRVFETP